MKNLLKLILLTVPFFSHAQFENFDYSLKWCTYFHSESNDLTVLNSAIDELNHIYIVGSIQSQFDLYSDDDSLYNHHGNLDGFIAKFDPDGNLVWFRNYGGTENDNITHLKIKDNHLFIIGTTGSTDGNIISSNSLNGMNDGYVAKLTTNGDFIWSKCIGGNLSDNLFNLSFSEQDDIYLVGESRSTTNLATPNSFKEFNAEGFALPFIAKLDSLGNKIWATYYGTNNLSFLRNIVVGSEGIYLMGMVFSNEASGFTFYSTAGSHKETADSGADLFLAKFDFEGNRIWGTYFGGIAQDFALGSNHLVGKNNELYFCFATSNNNLATPGAFQEDIGGSFSFLISKMTSTGAIEWSTYSGRANPNVFSHTLSSSIVLHEDDLYVTGTSSLSEMGTPGSYKQELTLGDTDAFVMKYNLAGYKLWGTYFGLENGDGGRNAMFTANGFYLLGNTNNENLNTPDSFINEYNNESDNFLSKFSLENLSINEISEKQGVIYPNPFQDYVAFDYPNKIKTIKLFDLLGKEVKSYLSVNSERFQVNLNTLQRGVYLVEIEFINHKKTIKKIVKSF